MITPCAYDVFLGCLSRDRPRVRKLAERLAQAMLKVWFDEWVIKPGDDILLAIESSTVLFRDPVNLGRHFVPVLLPGCLLPGKRLRYNHLDFRQDTPEAWVGGCHPLQRADQPLPGA
jgi:hypothetical protein